MSVSLRSLPDQIILSRTRELVARERKLTLGVLLHLNEIERRKLHLKHGYSTMFEYCTACLGYSASAAMRRIQAARCVAEFPEVHDLLVANRVNLSTVCMVAKVLTQDNKTHVLARVVDKSQREVEAVVAAVEPLSKLPRDRVRTVVVRVPAAAVVTSNYRNGSDSVRQGIENAVVPAATSVGNGGEPAPEQIDAPATPVAPTPVAVAAAHCEKATVPAAANYRNGNDAPAPEPVKLERRSVMQFSASQAFTSKLARVRALAAHRLPANATLEQVFELALDCFIEKEDPVKRQERRESRNGEPRPRSVSIQSPRAIPVPVRDQVFLRDQQRCSYVSPDGKRCDSTHALQIDHIQPVARGGSASIENLRLLCARHNRYEAEQKGLMTLTT